MIDVKRKGSKLIDCWANNVTLTFDHSHGLDHGILWLNFKMTKSQEWVGRLTWHKMNGSLSFMKMTLTFWWPRWGVSIVTQITSDVGMPSICLVINLITEENILKYFIQCKPDISRLVGSMERYRDISGSAIYRATAMSQNPGQVFQHVVSSDGAFVFLAANSARRQRISWHLSKFDVALQNRVVEFQTKAVCA